MDFTVRGYRALLTAACRQSQATGMRLDQVFAAILDGTYGVVASGTGGLYAIVSTSNAGQSVTRQIDSSSPSPAETGDAAQFLLSLTQECLAQTPPPQGTDLCLCVSSKLPARGVRRVHSNYWGMIDA